ncbi:MAG: low molecular weight protein-tyrosine-phosphatase [Pseudomonadota bacterium]
MTTRILFVCLGNICRSPTAEAVFAQRAAGLDVAVDSAGTGGWHVGSPPYGPMQQAALRRGYDMSDLRARQFIPDDFARFDLIIAMDAQNVADIEALRPGGSAVPVRLMTEFAPDAGARKVPDPYYTRDFDGALSLIEVAAEGLVRAVAKADAP